MFVPLLVSVPLLLVPKHVGTWSCGGCCGGQTAGVVCGKCVHWAQGGAQHVMCQCWSPHPWPAWCVCATMPIMCMCVWLCHATHTCSPHYSPSTRCGQWAVWCGCCWLLWCDHLGVLALLVWWHWHGLLWWLKGWMQWLLMHLVVVCCVWCGGC